MFAVHRLNLFLQFSVFCNHFQLVLTSFVIVVVLVWCRSHVQLYRQSIRKFYRCCKQNLIPSQRFTDQSKDNQIPIRNENTHMFQLKLKSNENENEKSELNMVDKRKREEKLFFGFAIDDATTINFTHRFFNFLFMQLSEDIGSKNIY